MYSILFYVPEAYPVSYALYISLLIYIQLWGRGGGLERYEVNTSGAKLMYLK